MPQGNKPYKIAIVGPGKIVVDQHIPAIAANPAFELVATVSRSGGLDGYPVFSSVTEMMASGQEVDVVAICTPPQVRDAIAREAMDAGLDILLEKPPSATPSAFIETQRYAAEKGVVLFATWHSRFAPMVERARQLIAERGLESAKIIWREDAQHWHPGQIWLWEPGGLGVFDPGINALSIFTRICGAAVTVTSAEFEVPANWYCPIAARMKMQAGDAPVDVDFDFRQKGEQSWDIEIACKDGSTFKLSMGGSKLSIDRGPIEEAPEAEYPGIYARFEELLDTRQSDADGTPLQLVADAFMIAKVTQTDDFEP